MSEIDGKEPGIIKEMPKLQRNELIKKFIFDKGISKSALERATGISRGTIIRVCKKMQQKLPRPQSVRPQSVLFFTAAPFFMLHI